MTEQEIAGSAGLSPRRRGNRGDAVGEGDGCGSIPAQAGEPDTDIPDIITREVYPRAGGGTGLFAQIGAGAEGLSPRRRGNHLLDLPPRDGHGSIPAQAGEPRGAFCAR